MELATYTNLIKHLPFEEQSFETKRGTWNREDYKGYEIFDQYIQDTFKGCTNVSISRSDLFHAAKGNFSNAVFSIILWGYPRNMRGNSFQGVLENTNGLEQMIQLMQNLTVQEFENINKSLKGTGIGLSTLTKILYFFAITLNGYRCLILDRRIINVLQSGKFSELVSLQPINEFNKDKYYLNYLKIMAEIAKANGYAVDQLELFIFMFGNSLKPVDSLKIAGGIHKINMGTSHSIKTQTK